MNTAFLVLAAACLASSDEPPLAGAPQVTEVQKLPVGDPVSIPVAQPTPGPVAGSATLPATNNPTASRIVPMPAESYEAPPPPRRFGLFRGLFHRKHESYSEEVPAPTTSSCACGAHSQVATAPTAPPAPKRQGWLRGIFHSNQSNDYVQQGDGQGVVISTEGPTNGHP